jgi:hypothetical protein
MIAYSSVIVIVIVIVMVNITLHYRLIQSIPILTKEVQTAINEAIIQYIKQYDCSIFSREIVGDDELLALVKLFTTKKLSFNLADAFCLILRDDKYSTISTDDDIICVY